MVGTGPNRYLCGTGGSLLGGVYCKVGGKGKGKEEVLE